MIRDLFRRAKHTGFTGPYYDGVIGSARFVWESIVARNELIMAATPESVARVSARHDPDLTLHHIHQFSDLKPYREEFERAYYPGYLNGWEAPFGWGERAVVGTVGGRLACYNWMQTGTAEGFPTYYGRMFVNEARVLRAGVLPAFRRRGLNAVMKHALLADFFATGVERVYVECYQYNTPSIRSLTNVGFTPVGLITVIEAWPLRNFVRWRSPGQLQRALREIGITTDTLAGAADILPDALPRPPKPHP